MLEQDSIFYWVSYPTAAKTWRNNESFGPVDNHRVRDGVPALAIGSLLIAEGWTYGGTLFNPPSPRPGREEKSQLEAVDRNAPLPAAIGSADCLVTTTRLPIDDPISGSKRFIDQSQTELERNLFRSARKVFSHCSRSRIDLVFPESDEHEVFQPFQSLEFFEGTGKIRIRTNNLRKLLPSSHHTIAYAFHVPSSNEHPFHLLGAFGIGGKETLVWTELLRTDFREPFVNLMNSRRPSYIVGTFRTSDVIYHPLLNIDRASTAAAILFQADL